ncbi:MAG: AMP-binding protein, partial [Candidatus Eremiobacteraeota bacterium]|nr:AMP-binding protein [Candidatus Eremiobacteraeota bacterium]
LEVDLGLGSLERLELVRRLEERLGRPVDEQAVFTARQVSELLSQSQARQSQQKTLVSGRQMPARPLQSQTLLEALVYQAEQQPDQTALVLLDGDGEAAAPSYSELVAQARRLGAGLLALGVRPGERVAIMLPTSLDFFTVFYGCLWIGAVAVPLYPPMRLDQAEDFILRQDAILQNSGARVLVTLPALGPMAELLRRRSSLHTITSPRKLAGAGVAPMADLDDQSLAFVQYTSGSTGKPKGVPLTHRNLLTNIWDIGTGFAMGCNDVMVSWLPLYHDMGLIGTSLGSFSHGLPLVVMGPEKFLGRPARWLRAFSDYRGTMTAAPNFAYAICAHKLKDEELQGLDLSSWRIALNGAEPILAETTRAFVERFEPYGFRPGTMFPAYGLAEATLAVSFNPIGRGTRVEQLLLTSDGRLEAGQDSFVSSGLPLENMQVRIVDASGAALPERRQGRVEVAGDSVMAGYFGEPRRQGRWHDTGDLGFMLEGELFLTGRQKDLIIVAGRNLHPHDIEASVATLDGVRPGCVVAFGVDHEGSQRLVVLAEAREGHRDLAEAIRAQVQQVVGLAAEVVVLAPRTLPKTPSGKVRRAESRQRYLENGLRPPRLSGKWLARAGLAWLEGSLPRLSWAARSAYSWGCALACWGELKLGQPLERAVPRLFGRLGIEIEVRGCPAAAANLCVVANHASLLDPLLLLAAWPELRFVMAESGARHPLLRGLVDHHILVRRGLGEADQALAQMTSALRSGACMAVFPEGGIEAAPGLRSFATGAFRATAASGARLQPVAIAGSRELMPQGQWVPARGR